MNLITNFLKRIPKKLHTLAGVQPQPNTQPAVQPWAKPKTKIPKISKKALIVLAVVILILLLVKAVIPFFVRTVDQIINKGQGTAQPPPTPIIPEPKDEPVTFSWETYTNQRLNFQVSVPSSWERKEYEPKSATTNQATVAFDPKKLPDKYIFARSYYAVIVTPVGVKEEFNKHKNLIESIGTDSITETFLDGIRGADTGSFITVEHKGYIYELVLKSVRSDEGKFVYTQISKRVISSFKFLDEQNAPNQLGDIRIDDGNVVGVDQNGKKTVLINKSKFTGDGIKNFSEVKVSPDGSLMCFIGNTDSPATFLYYSDVGGKTPFRITGGKNCVWSHDSGKIAFNNVVSDVSHVDVFIFIINSKDLKNITRIVGGEFIRFYEIPECSQDDNFIVSNFTAFDPSGTLQSYTGSSAINATTGEVVDK